MIKGEAIDRNDGVIDIRTENDKVVIVDCNDSSFDNSHFVVGRRVLIDKDEVEPRETINSSVDVYSSAKSN